MIREILTLAGCVFTKRRMSVSANTALRCTTCIAYILYSKCILLTERRRFTTLWSSVMSVDCTPFCAVENFGQSCEKIQTMFIFVRYGKIQHMSKEQGVRLKAHTLFLGRVLYFPIPHSNEHRLHICELE